jgi:hypothetical protein
MAKYELLLDVGQFTGTEAGAGRTITVHKFCGTPGMRFAGDTDDGRGVLTPAEAHLAAVVLNPLGVEGECGDDSDLTHEETLRIVARARASVARRNRANCPA